MSEVFIQLTDPLKEITVSVRDLGMKFGLFLNDKLIQEFSYRSESDNLVEALSYFFESYRAPESEDEEPATVKQ